MRKTKKELQLASQEIILCKILTPVSPKRNKKTEKTPKKLRKETEMIFHLIPQTSRLPTGAGAGAAGAKEAVPLAAPAAAARMWSATGEAPGAGLPLADHGEDASSSRSRRSKTEEHRNGNGGGARLMLLSSLPPPPPLYRSKKQPSRGGVVYWLVRERGIRPRHETL